jgi:hypothetical protein
MRNVKTILAAAVMGLGIATTAQAALVISVTQAATNPPQSPTVTATGHTGYIVNVRETGQPITSFNLKDGAGFGINGPLHQRWAGDGEGNFFANGRGTATGADSSTSNNFDSHILIPASDEVLPPGGAPAEDNNTTSPTGINPDTALADSGYGTFLRYNAGWIGGTSAASNTPGGVNLAYLVLKNTDSVQVTGDYTVLGGTSTIPFSFTVPVPEPTSAGLMAVAAVGMLARRRRA